MNRPGGPRYSAPSKATSSTVCQKCLQKGHFSYECITSAQNRPYKARPSRTQQLLNPDLAPPLTYDAPTDLMRKKGIADELLAKEGDRGRHADRSGSRSRSASSASVSTVSTNKSRSPSPPPKMSKDDDRSSKRNREFRSQSRSPARGDQGRRQRRRSPAARIRSRSRSPVPGSGRGGRARSPPGGERSGRGGREAQPGRGSGGPSSLRDLSPYSRRLALTESMNK